MKFYGEQLTDDECDLKALTAIHFSHLENEALASHSKWFDYRLWPHIKASYHFADVYINAYRKYYSQTRDVNVAKIVNAFSSENPLATRECTNIHLARQAFDMLGVRYEFGIGFVMRRFQTRGWRTMPRVNQMYAEEIMLDLKDAWAIECRAKLQIPKHPTFQSENYCGSITQDQFHDWMEGEIKKRAHKYMAIGQVVYRDNVMPERVAIARFGEDLVARGKRDAL